MMTKLVAIYSKPDDVAAFDRYYDEIHTPLAKAIPGLSELRVTRMSNRFMGDADIYLIAELVFPDKETLNAAMASNENKVTGADLANFANGKVSLFFAPA